MFFGDYLELISSFMFDIKFQFQRVCCWFNLNVHGIYSVYKIYLSHFFLNIKLNIIFKLNINAILLVGMKGSWSLSFDLF